MQATTQRKTSQKISEAVLRWICRKGKTKQIPCGSVFQT